MTVDAWMRQRRGWLGPAVVVVAIVPIVVATVRALARGWVAIGDDGLLLLRTQDVATANHPLLGTWTSASLSAGRSINNPGPLWFDALAPFVKVAGPSVGFAVGVMVANIAAVVLAAWAARRVGGELAMVLVTALSAGLAWSMGSELLYDAWQPHAMLLPFWALLILLWALAAGQLWTLPWVLGIASLLLQTHLAFAYVVAIIGVAAIVAGLLVARRDQRRGGPGALAPAARRQRRSSSWLAWIQPLIDQIAGEGNLGALLRSGSGGDDGRRLGLRIGIRLVGSVVALPPWWTRPGFSDTIRPTGVITGDGPLELSEGNVAAARPGAARAGPRRRRARRRDRARLAAARSRRRRPRCPVGDRRRCLHRVARPDAGAGDRAQPPPDALAVAGVGARPADAGRRRAGAWLGGPCRRSRRSAPSPRWCSPC